MNLNGKLDSTNVVIGNYEDFKYSTEETIDKFPTSIWQLGSVLFTLYTHKSITSLKLSTLEELIPDTKLLDLLKKMLEHDPKKRIITKQILEHPFITGDSNLDSDSS